VAQGEPIVIAARLDEIRAAHRQLVVAHGELLRTLRETSESLSRAEVRGACQEVDEAFVRFVDATESFWLVAARSEAVARSKPTLEHTNVDATFSALSRSSAILRRNGFYLAAGAILQPWPG